jgi:membrane-bound metal-dependent hydrolase YbcI (DUF457 family)
MNFEAHLAAGWALAHMGGVETRRFRAWITFAAVAPDLDVISYLWGERAYATCHHALGHNVFFSWLVTTLAVWALRDRPWKALLFSQLAYYSHYFGDYFFTRFPLEFFWPVSHRGFIYSYRIGLDHPINLFLSYASFVVIVAMAIWFKRTPMELLSPQLDKRIVNLFRGRDLVCHVCGHGANENCVLCGQPVCRRHGRIGRRFRVTCSACHHAARTASQARQMS